jgi:hypothetical protein
MNKRKFVFYSLLVVLLFSFSGFQYYKHQRNHNIFDQIYYEESDYHNYTFLRNGRAFYKLKGLFAFEGVGVVGGVGRVVAG